MQEYKTRTEKRKAEEAASKRSRKLKGPMSLDQERSLEEVPAVEVEMPEKANVVIPPASQEPLNDEGIDSGNKMVQGTFWMTFGSIFSRLLGALYVIPWNAMMGAGSQMGNTLFAVGYTPYSFFLSLGIAGFPSAMSKQIAQYNAQRNYRAGQELFKKSMYFMAITGIVSSILMYLLAPIIAEYSPGASVEDSTLVIRSLAPALLLVPAMSLMRGYFQGYQNMVPSAITQVVEQVVRVAYILGATFLVMQVFNGSVAVAVAHSTFAAFVGAIASFVMLMWYYRKHMTANGSVIAMSPAPETIDTRGAIKEMLKESVPFIIVGSGITFGKMIDQFTFEHIMLSTTEYGEAVIANLYGLFSFNADKLIMIIISLAVGMSATSIPLLVENYIGQNVQQLRKQVQQILELFAFVMFPAAFGMMAVSEPIFALFYGVDRYTFEGYHLLMVASFMSIILGLFTIVSSILQSFGKHRLAIRYLIIGLVVKVVLQYPLIAVSETSGALWATTIGFLVTSLLSLGNIYQLTGFDWKETGNSVGAIAVITGWMMVAAYVTIRVARLFLSPERKLVALILVLLVAAIGGFVYLYLALKTRMADRVLGQRVGGLRRVLRIR